MPFAGIITSRVGCRRVIVVGTIVMALVFPLLSVLDGFPALVATLLVFGASLGLVDVTVNIQAVLVERDAGRPMMSGFHGLFSIGGIVGAGGMSLVLSLNVAPLLAAGLLSVIALVALVLVVPGLLPYADRSTGKAPLFVVPRGGVLLIGVLCFFVFLAEGSVLDWSGVFLTTLRGADLSAAGLGYATFAVAMTIGRLTGDRIRTALGERMVLLGGSLIGALGFVVVLAIPSFEAGLIGYFLVGAGASNAVPVLFSAAGRSRDMPSGLAVTAISMLGYLGLLAGPALIGFVAHATSLTIAFALLAAAFVVVAACYRIADR
jgi:predicted MFS family arabinose efflux permease